MNVQVIEGSLGVVGISMEDPGPGCHCRWGAGGLWGGYDRVVVRVPVPRCVLQQQHNFMLGLASNRIEVLDWAVAGILRHQNADPEGELKVEKR